MGTSIDTRSDEEVAALVQRGDSELFGVLMQRYEPKLSRYGRKFLSDRDTVEDIVQDIFVKAYQNIQSFDHTRRFSPWIYRIAHNAYVNQLRKSSRLPITLFDFDALVAHTVYEDPAEADRERLAFKQVLDESLEKIPQKYKEILLLRYYEDMDYKEIADVLEVPIGTVSVRIKRAKDAIKKIAAPTL